MNPEKRAYNGWILCPSTRFLGKFYYFNPATGEAVWNLSDMERRMASQPNFTHSEKWHAYPEPDCPPEDTSNPWGYQPDFRVFPQASPPFGQAVFPKYTPNVTDMFPSSMPWVMPSMPPSSVYMPPMMPTYNPMAQSWASFRANQKQYMQEKSLFPNNPYMQKVPNYNQGMSRQVFGAKPKPNNIPVFSQMINQNREVIRKRPHPAAENGNDKEPLFKRLRSQMDLQNENIFGASNPFQTQSFESLIPNKTFKTPAFQQNNSTSNHCNCMLSRSYGNLNSQFSKSYENLTKFGKPKENIFKPEELKRPRSLESLLKPPSEVSSNFSLENSFVFPLNKSDSKVSSAKSLSSVKKLQNSTVSQSGQDTKKVQSESSDSKLSETDLRYILMARKKKSSPTDLPETSKHEKVEVKKIKTSYSENSKLSESFSKKRVTFDLGVEDSIPDNNPDVNAAHTTDNATPREVQIAKRCYVVADVEALLAEFQLIEEFVKSDEAYTLLIPAHVSRDIEATCGELGGAARRRVLAARHITRHIARQSHEQSHIQVQPEDPAAGPGVTEDPTLNCCLGVCDEAQMPILITNNEKLYEKATSYYIECYTTEDIKDVMATPKPEVSFDIKKVGNTVKGIATDNGEPASIPVNYSRPKLFENADASNQLFKKPKNCDDEKMQLKRHIDINDRNPFFDKDDDLLEETQFKIENLKLQEKDNQKNREALAVKKKQDTEKENSNVFKNGDETKEDYLTARKKLKSINVYNMDGLLKTFNIKSKDMEERIMMRMDEYVCIFCQIMEAVFLDVVEQVPTDMREDFTKSPVQNLLVSLREVFADDRTARALADKLSTILDGAFVRDDVHGRLLLELNPNEFVKMFACGTLLVKVLRNILPNNATLEEGEVLLEQLEHSLERWDTEPQPNTPVTPGAGAEPRPEYVKKPSEVLLFLAKHYPEWQSYSTTGNYNKPCLEKQKSKAEVPEKTTAKVVRTFGRNLGLLKLESGKPLKFSTNKENNDKENNDKHNDNNDINDKGVETDDNKEKNIPKTIRKLAIECLNLPPKFKEIDVEKRENDDKELTQMLDQMMNKQPLTKRYELKSIIINKDDNDTDKIQSYKKDEQVNFNKDLKLKLKIDTTKKTNLQTKNVTIDNDVKNTAPKKFNQEQNMNTVDINKNALDLDVLDYSDINESFIQEREQSMIDDDSSSNRMVIVESDHCNDVTTTRNDLDDSSPNNEDNNQNNNDSDNGNNNNIIDIENESVDNDNENCDSGIESYQAYSFVQLFLMNLSKTFILIKEFIEASLSDLRKGIDEDTKEILNEKAGYAHDKVKNIINNLNLIIDRESNPETALLPMLMKGDPEADTDKRMTKFRRVVSKCVSQARVLERSLQILQRITQGDLLMRDISDVADNYSNLFE